MILKRFVVGPLETNCYVFGDEDTKEAVVIDPGGDANTIKNYITKNNLQVKYVINTHGHGDHIGNNRNFNAEILIHKLDSAFLNDPSLNLSDAFAVAITSPKATRLLNDGDEISIGKLPLRVMHTPGHTPGSICLNHNDIVFSGDTLFFEGIGRTDLPNSSWEALLGSIKNKLMVLPDGCKVYPGHGPETTIGHERRYNPFVK